MKKFLRHLTPSWLLRFYHWKLAFLANLIWGFPSRGMRVIGVTGTNGKTTTCFLLRSILMAEGRSVGMLTTVAFGIGKKLEQNRLNMTTVSPFLLQKYLYRMRRAGCTDIIIETTSHAIDQHRIWGIKYFALALTNITHDHLDYHGTFAGYVAAKKSLFTKPHHLAVLNADDPLFDEFWRGAGAAGQRLTYGITHKSVDVTARKVLAESERTLFTLVTQAGQSVIDLRLPGQFNVANALAAAALAYGLGVGMEKIKHGLEAVEQVPGRMEKVTITEGKGKLPFTTIIDYAHTPDALDKVMATLRSLVRGRLIAVFGATGNRDQSKRPLLGAIGGRLADVVIITDEEPYDEDPAAIIEAVAEGVARGATKKYPKKMGESFFKVAERNQAIKKAINMARSGDVVLVTGMGDQSYRVVKGRHLPWSDRETVQKALAERIRRQ